MGTKWKLSSIFVFLFLAQANGQPPLRLKLLIHELFFSSSRFWNVARPPFEFCTNKTNLPEEDVSLFGWRGNN